MAYRVEDSMSLVIEFMLPDPNGKQVTKKVTLSGINQRLTDDQYFQVASKIDGLLKYPAVAYGLITKNLLAAGNSTN